MADGPTFTHCPYDGSPLAPRPDGEGTTRPTCSSCGFTDYGNPKPCVAVIVEDAGRILLGKRAHEPSKGLWDILGGFIDAGETAEEAVHREMKEESGLEVRITRFLGTFLDTYGPRRLPTLNLAYVAVPTGGAARAASDIAELRWFAAAELPAVWAFPHQPRVIEAWRDSTQK